MSFYIYQLVEPLILLNTLTKVLDINYRSATINYRLTYQLSTIFIKQRSKTVI